MVIPPRAFWTSVTFTSDGVERERSGDLVADLHGELLAEGALLAKASQVELERLRLETALSRPEFDRRGVEVGLVRDRADGGQFVADQFDRRDARVRERLEAGVGIAACVSEGDELLLHGVTVAPTGAAGSAAIQA